MLHPLRLALLALAVTAGAQEKTETLLQADTSFPAQGGPGFKIAYFGDQSGLLIGGRGAVMLGDNAALGAGGYSLASEVVTSQGGLKRDISFSYGGVTLDNYFLPQRLLFLNVSMLVGPGFGTGSRRNTSAEKDHTLFVVVEPEFNVMLNVTRELRLSLGCGYRFVAGADNERVLGASLSGFSGTFTLMYGKL